MKILQINTVYNVGSTGKIVAQIQSLSKSKGHIAFVAYRYQQGKGKETDTYTISNWLDCHIHNRLARMTMKQGSFSKRLTRRFLKEINSFSPDIIHLHNIHGSYINHKLLFDYIKKYNIRVIWTLHDCWAFTGYCPYFDMVKCDKWKKQCQDCPLHKVDPINIFDRSKYMYQKKKKWFTGVKNMTLVAPSQWLADLAKQSFLKEYPVRVINNGIDLEIFKPTTSNLRKKYFIEDKFVVLGVAFDWGKRKGLDVFIELSKRLSEDYKIVLVGTNDYVDKQLPNNIISIHRTQTQTELAEIYTLADVFVNPTREENYPTVNMEALACGTPVVTFQTGGSAEMLDGFCGVVVAKDNIDMLQKEIENICKNHLFAKENCLGKARTFDMYSKFAQYVDMYEEK